MNRQIHHWLVVDFESNERDPRTTPLRTEYDGLTIHIQPRMDEYCDVMSTFVRPGEDLQQIRLKLNRFLSAMAWKDRQCLCNARQQCWRCADSKMKISLDSTISKNDA